MNSKVRERRRNSTFLIEFALFGVTLQRLFDDIILIGCQRVHVPRNQ